MGAPGPPNLAIDRHERHHRHAGEKAAYLRSFLNDGQRDGSVTITRGRIGSVTQ
jgi:hypothetical protein